LIEPNQILQGDCQEVIKGIASKSIDAIVTDVPYGFLKHKIETQINIPEVMKEFRRVLKDDGTLCYFGKVPNIYEWFQEAIKYIPFKEEIIWDKSRASSPNHTVLKTHENIYIHSSKPLNEIYMDFYFCALSEYKDLGGMDRINTALKGLLNSPERLREYAEYLENPKTQYVSKRHRVENTGAFISPGFVNAQDWINAVDIVRRGYKGRSVVTFLSGNCGKGTHYNHPTVKPVPLMEFLVKLCSSEGDIILDPFAGTGTTLVSAKDLNRNYIGIEIEEEYTKICNDRLEDVTPKLF